jgi:hypothetical protein
MGLPDGPNAPVQVAGAGGGEGGADFGGMVRVVIDDRDPAWFPEELKAAAGAVKGA